jgi:hypothetical protein
VQDRQITVLTSNQGALLAIRQPLQQSGQTSICQIYDACRLLREKGNHILMAWAPQADEFVPGKKAKTAARQATKKGDLPREHTYRAKSTTLNAAISKQRSRKTLPEGTNEHLRRIDTALPGKHTRRLYDSFKRKGASILAQLRTGMARLNGYLHRIGAAESDQCACGQAKETIEHFLFRCIKWTSYRTQMLQQTNTRRGNLSFYLGGRAPSDTEPWTPNIEAVRATVQYAIDTGRFEAETEQLPSPQNNNSNSDDDNPSPPLPS